MADINEEARIPVYINDEQAKSALKTLTAEAEKWKRKMFEAMSANDLTGMKAAEDQLKKVNRQMTNLKKEAFDANKVLQNLSNASLNDLRKTEQALRKNINEVNRGTKEWKEYHAQLQRVLAEKQKINGELSGQLRSGQSFFSRTADGFNKYFGMATAAIASLTGIAFTVKSAVNEFAKFDDKLSDVMKTTGLTKDQVKALNAELEKIDTRTSQEGLLELARIAGKLGISAEKDVLGFVRAADKINVALTEDLGGNAEQAINDLGKLVDVFKLKDTYGIEDSLLKVGSAINSLGAAGTANEAYIVEFSKRLAGIAPSAGISIEKVLGLAATLDELAVASEVSGTVVNNVIAAMFKDTAEYAKIAGMELTAFTNLLNTDANEAFIKVLEGAKGSGAGFSEMAVNLDKLGLDGARSTGVLAVLANNIDKLREKQAYSNEEFKKGTSIIDENNKKQTNAQAVLDKAKKAFTQMQRELGEKLAPAYTSIIHKSSALLQILGATVEFLFKHSKAIIIVTSAVVGYTVAAKIATAADGAWAAVKGVLTGQITLATIAQRAWNLALKANPIGLIIGIIAGGIAWLISWNNETGKITEAFKRWGPIFEDIKNYFITLYNESFLVRAGFHYFFATLQTGFTIVKVFISSFIEQLKLVGKVLLAVLTLDPKGIKRAFDEYAANMKSVVVDNAGKLGETWANGFNAAIKGKIKPVQISVTGPLLSKQNKDFTFSGIGDLIQAQNPYVRPGSPSPNSPKNPNSKPPIEDDEAAKKAAEEAFKKAQEAFDKAATEEKNKLKQQLLDKKLTQEQFNLEMYSLELAHLIAMKELRARFAQETTTADAQILDKKIDGQNQANKQLEDDEKLYNQVKQDNAKESEKQEDDALKAMEADYTKFVKDEVNKQIDILAKQFELEKEIAAARIELKDMQVEAVGQLASALAGMFEQGSAAQIAAIAVEKAIAIAQIWINYAREMSAISLASANIAAMPIPGARVAALAYMGTMSAKAKVQAGINTGIIVAQTVASAVSSGSRGKKDQYYAGGPTGPGSKYEEKGVVHAEEYVIPQEGTKNPQLKPVIDMIELARRNGSLARLDLRPIFQTIPAKGFSSGGFASSSSALSPLPSALGPLPSAGSDPALLALISANTAAMQELKKLKIYATIEDIRKGDKNYTTIENTRGL